MEANTATATTDADSAGDSATPAMEDLAWTEDRVNQAWSMEGLVCNDWAHGERDRDSLRPESAHQQARLARELDGINPDPRNDSAKSRGPDPFILRGEDAASFDPRIFSKLSASRSSSPSKDVQPGPHVRRHTMEIKCIWPDCRSTFPRQYELDRHTSQKHHVPEFWDPVVGCLSKEGPPRFTRSDKLTDHISTHCKDAMLSCIVHGCDARPQPLDLMAIHVRQHGCEPDTKGNHIRAIANAASASRIKCPIQSCARRVGLASLLDHLKIHDPTQLFAEKEAVSQCGYSLVGDHGTPKTQALRSDRKTPTTLVVVCPVCSAKLASHEEFSLHMMKTHVVSDVEHYRTWIEYLFNVPSKKGKSSQITKDLKCPVCNHSETVNFPEDAQHQLSLLKDSTQLVPLRRQIRSLWPDFATHPIFNDLRHSARERSNESSPGVAIFKKYGSKTFAALNENVEGDSIGSPFHLNGSAAGLDSPESNQHDSSNESLSGLPEESPLVQIQNDTNEMLKTSSRAVEDRDAILAMERPMPFEQDLESSTNRPARNEAASHELYQNVINPLPMRTRQAAIADIIRRLETAFHSSPCSQDGSLIHVSPEPDGRGGQAYPRDIISRPLSVPVLSSIELDLEAFDTADISDDSDRPLSAPPACGETQSESPSKGGVNSLTSSVSSRSDLARSGRRPGGSRKRRLSRDGGNDNNGDDGREKKRIRVQRSYRSGPNGGFQCVFKALDSDQCRHAACENVYDFVSQLKYVDMLVGLVFALTRIPGVFTSTTVFSTAVYASPRWIQSLNFMRIPIFLVKSDA